MADILKNPLIAQYLLGAASGMMQNPISFGHALAGGIQGGSNSALAGFNQKQQMYDEQSMMENKVRLMLEQQRQNFQQQYDQGKKITNDIISTVNWADISPRDQAMLKAASASGDPDTVSKIINSIYGPKSSAAKRWGEIQNQQVNGRTAFFQKNLDDPNEVNPVGAPSLDPAIGQGLETINGQDGGQDQVVFDNRGMPHKVASAKAPDNIPEATQKELMGISSLQNQTQRLVDSYRPEFSGGDLIDRALQVADGKLSFSEIARSDPDSIDQVMFWKDYQGLVNDVRNEKFGASLTPGEKTEFEKYIIGRGTDPTMVQAYLAKQRDIVSQAANRKNELVQGGYYQGGQKEATKKMMRSKKSQNIFEMD